MRKLIILPGRMDSPFFLNELKELKKNFDEIVLISYPINRTKCQIISNCYEVKYHIVDIHSISLQVIKEFIKWMKDSGVKREIRENVRISKNGFYKLLYIIWYGLFAVQAHRWIEKEIDGSGGYIYLYAYWLSRPAYAIAYYQSHMNADIKRVFSRAHGYDLYEYRNRINYLPFRKIMYEYLDNIFFISEDGKEYFEKWLEASNFSLKQNQLSVNYLGTYNPDGKRKKIYEKKQIVVASCSAIIPEKRIDLIIDALEKAKDIKMKWIHIGDGELFEKMQEETKRKLPQIESCFLGKVDNSKILKIYIDEDVDYFINLSDAEGIPVSIMEAMSVGIPVIGRNVGGMREIVNGRNGCLLEKNIEYKKIQSFLTIRLKQPERYAEYSENAWKYWKEKFDGKNNYSMFIKKIL